MSDDDKVRLCDYRKAADLIEQAAAVLDGLARYVESEAGARWLDEIIAGLNADRERVLRLLPREPGPLDIVRPVPQEETCPDCGGLLLAGDPNALAWKPGMIIRSRCPACDLARFSYPKIVPPGRLPRELEA